MARTVERLFGLTPDAVMQQEAEARRKEIEAYSSPYRRMGAYIGQQASGMFGGQEPSAAVIEAQKLQEAKQGLNLDTPEGMRDAAKRLADAGFQDRALELIGMADEAEYKSLRITGTKEEQRRAKEQEERTKKARESAKKMFSKLKGGAPYADLIDMNVDPADAYKAYIDANKLDIKEIQTYNNGTDQILAGVDAQGRLVQATPAGWQQVTEGNWTQGKLPDANELKKGRTVGTKGQVFDIYNNNWDDLVDTGYFDKTGTKIAEVEQITGISNLDTKQGKQELYSIAEGIRANNPGMTEREALDRALKGERVTTSATTKQPAPKDDGKPDLSKTKTK